MIEELKGRDRIMLFKVANKLNEVIIILNGLVKPDVPEKAEVFKTVGK